MKDITNKSSKLFTYSCEKCQKFINSPEEITEYYKFCSQKCFYSYVMEILDKYTREELVYLWNVYCYGKNRVLNDITPHYAKALLSSKKGGFIIYQDSV